MSELTVIGYARVSSQEQAGEGISLEAQKAKIESWATLAGATLIDVIEDPAVSGTRLLSQRPGGRRIEALLQSTAPEVDAVVISRLDRLGRNASETLGHLHRFSTGRVGLVSILDRLDLSTPQGRAMAGVAAVFGQLERELIAQRTSEALAQLKAEGKAYGASPFGFVRDGDRLVPDPSEQAVLRKIRSMRGAGKSYRNIAAWLDGESIPAKRGGKWSPMSVRSVCRTAKRNEGNEVGCLTRTREE